MKTYTLLLMAVPLLAGCNTSKKELKHVMVEPTAMPYSEQTISCEEARKLADNGQWVLAWQVANSAIAYKQGLVTQEAQEHGTGQPGVESVYESKDCYDVLREYLLKGDQVSEPHFSPAFKP